jgi:hypothetical protein
MNPVQLKGSATEVTTEMAIEIFMNNQKLYAYDQKLKIEYEVKDKKDLNDAIRDEDIFFIHNK